MADDFGPMPSYEPTTSFDATPFEIESEPRPTSSHTTRNVLIGIAVFVVVGAIIGIVVWQVTKKKKKKDKPSNEPLSGYGYLKYNGKYLGTDADRALTLNEPSDTLLRAIISFDKSTTTATDVQLTILYGMGKLTILKTNNTVKWSSDNGAKNWVATGNAVNGYTLKNGKQYLAVDAQGNVTLGTKPTRFTLERPQDMKADDGNNYLFVTVNGNTSYTAGISSDNKMQWLQSTGNTAKNIHPFKLTTTKGSTDVHLQLGRPGETMIASVDTSNNIVFADNPSSPLVMANSTIPSGGKFPLTTDTYLGQGLPKSDAQLVVASSSENATADILIVRGFIRDVPTGFGYLKYKNKYLGNPNQTMGMTAEKGLASLLRVADDGKVTCIYGMGNLNADTTVTWQGDGTQTWTIVGNALIGYTFKHGDKFLSVGDTITMSDTATTFTFVPTVPSINAISSFDAKKPSYYIISIQGNKSYAIGITATEAPFLLEWLQTTGTHGNSLQSFQLVTSGTDANLVQWVQGEDRYYATAKDSNIDMPSNKTNALTLPQAIASGSVFPLGETKWLGPNTWNVDKTTATIVTDKGTAVTDLVFVEIDHSQ